MTKADLISRLEYAPDSAEIMILDGENGGGVLREINLGPAIRQISETDAQETADCEGRAGKSVLAIGYGCY